MTKLKRAFAAVLCIIVMLSAFSVGAYAADDGRWVGAWSTTPVEAVVESNGVKLSDFLMNSTVRIIIKPTLSGTRVRFKISNRFGNTAIKINGINVARAVGDDSNEILTETIIPLKVRGAESFSVAAGEYAYTDPFDMKVEALEAIAVTYGPGLVGALLVGVSVAKAISFATKIPLVGVHHIEGHISANYIENKELEPPFICLVVSGGHTHLVKVADYGKYEILGRTRDDAAGEAFDKVARAIGLGYPGGPKIDKVSREGNPEAIHFPRAKVDENIYDFSFSGLKSAVLNYINSAEMKGETISVPDVAASFQQAVVDVLVEHSMEAVRRNGLKKFAIAGGVASNSTLREAMRTACVQNGIEFFHPSPILCTDNAAMIGAAGYYDYCNGIRSDYYLNAVPNLKLGER